MLTGQDIVCVGFNDWDSELWTNQHHLMSRLARENRVLFVESLGLRRPTVRSRDLRRIGRRLLRGVRGPRSADGLHILSPLVLPFHGSRMARQVNDRLLPALVARSAGRLGMREPILWTYVPQAEVLIDPLESRRVIYHLVDDIAAHHRVDTASFEAAERRLLARDPLVIASSQTVGARLREHGAAPVVLPNVADTARFATALEDGPVDPAIAGLPSPRIVFTGAIAAVKIDLDLLRALAQRRRNWSIVLVGPIGLGDPGTDTAPLAAEPNVHFLGRRAQADLPAVLRGAQAGLIPYRRNPLTDGIFPLKVYEYLAAGLPVVSTPLPALAGVADVVLANGVNEMVATLERLLAADSPELRRQRSSRARAHNWESRLEEIAALVERSGPARQPVGHR